MKFIWKRKKAGWLAGLLAVAVCAVLFGSIFVQTEKNKETVLYGPGQQLTAQEKQNVIRENLQDRLQQQMETLDEISTSSVTIGTGEDGLPAVNAVIRLSSGKALSSEQEESIKTLIQRSVGDLSEEDICLTVSDSADG